MGVAGFRTFLGLALAATSCTSIAADQRSFDQTAWRVAAINRQATPATKDYYLTFSDGRVGGRVGCNNFGGRYSVGETTIKVVDVRATMIACADPAASFESDALGVLSKPMRMDWASARRLDLANELGTLTLERLP